MDNFSPTSEMELLVVQMSNARAKPRNWHDVQARIETLCRDPQFANDEKVYYKISQDRHGLGIRFVEMALNQMTNVLLRSSLTGEDEKKEIHHVSVTDLERNVTHAIDVLVPKTVERKKLPDGDTALSTRKNSYGDTLYELWANPDDMKSQRSALIAKATRAMGLKIIPYKIKVAAERTIKMIRNNPNGNIHSLPGAKNATR